MDVLVTGATGFIGRHLVGRLANARHHIKAFVRPGTHASWLDELGVEVVRGDIEDAEAVEQAVEDCQIVFHLAAKTESLGLLTRKDVRTANVQGTENIARAAARARVDRLVFSSTVSVYGRIIKNRTIDEETETRPDSPYGESKVLAERIVLSRPENDHLPAVVARFSTVWGAGTTSWLGLFRSIASGQFRLFGDGANHHHLVDISDLIEGLLLCASVQSIEGRTYIVAGPEPVQLRELIRMIGDEVGASSFPPNLPAAPLHVYKVLDGLACTLLGRKLPRADRLAIFLGDRSFDISRARGELGYSPQIPVRETIHRLAEWFRSQGHLPRLERVGKASDSE